MHIPERSIKPVASTDVAIGTKPYFMNDNITGMP